MSNVSFRMVGMDGVRFLTVYLGGEIFALTDETHSNLDQIAEAARNNDADLAHDLIDKGRAIQRAFDDITIGRVSVRDGVVHFDDDPMDTSVTKAILKFLEEGEDVTPLVKFMENVMANPQEHSREQFYRWIEYHDFPIDSEGCIVAYKGLRKDGNGGFTSLHAGNAIVNGKPVSGQIPNAVGDIITMPRSAVQHDPNVGCHTGLHAGTWEYASSFGDGITMHVRINPRDVVSVPNDCESQKVRVSRYEVLSIAQSEHSGAYFGARDTSEEEEHDEDWCDDDWCEECEY